ncbi:MAG: HEPN domain-containing protein [Saccharolobus sp.]|uniref:HEPN domain-containing protein n=2 Tax=Saccharolobus shibatae TaxID=2286 RepID=A0A8F5GZY4_9CREN|nr:HEPN domain-containing protein [Saccharolobus shibatae]MCH4816430.1 HEPN domain-containing protein [Saccharolobus shibatae]QXJ29435.1 HEPN domain-containing protein [Saccharolobus shibatae B12]QXJ32676.1 HEPN domain-containing protein [Saccharolobus shibatae]QXJ35804.1 HEPN domain-containing protein [Saccharolobus shibatae]
MNNNDLAKSYVRQAEERIKHSKEALNEGNYPYVVRQCQEAVELLLKASLRYVGIEPPKLHDVGYLLRKEKDRFPQWFQDKIDEFAYYSRVLRSERESAMYGDEETGATPEELYSKFDAENAIKMCESVHVSVKKLIKID